MNPPDDRPDDEPDERDRWPDPPPLPPSELSARPEPRFFRILRSTIAPPVLEDAGHDAPLSPRGRLLFWGTVAVLGVAIAVLFVATLAK
jgi:hypothetical protein